MSDLIIIGYPDEETAGKVWGGLVRLERDYLVHLEDAAIIRRDSRGRLHITTPAHHGVAWGSLSGLFWRTLTGLLLLLPLAPLRLCLTCGHVGCCDSSPLRHARGHAYAAGHPIIRSLEPGENWRWCYVDESYV